MRIKLIFLLFTVILFSIVYGAPKRKVIVLKAMEIKGQIQKPEAIYFLSRARFDYKSLDLNISFMKKVKESVFKESAF